MVLRMSAGDAWALAAVILGVISVVNGHSGNTRGIIYFDLREHLLDCEHCDRDVFAQ